MSMDEQERRRHLETLQATPARLKGALKGLPKKLLAWRPAPGKWSILEIVCHLRDMEREAYLARYRRILAEDNPLLPDIDGDVIALERDYRGQRLGAAVADWSKARRECLKLLKGVRGEKWQRHGTHQSAGRLSMEDFLRRHALGNDAAHLEQIEAIKRRFAILTRLESAPGALAAATKGLPAERARTRPADGKWSVVEIACHLRDVEQVFAERFTKMAFSERPSFWMMDNGRMASLRSYHEAELAASVKAFRQAREETLTLLRALPLPTWQRTGLHPRRGEVTLEVLADVLASHDASHLARIRELAAC
jgi:hypothetical protein